MMTLRDTATLDLFVVDPPCAFDPAEHRRLQREMDRLKRCWRSTGDGHNRVCICYCGACAYERTARGLAPNAPLPGRSLTSSMAVAE